MFYFYVLPIYAELTTGNWYNLDVAEWVMVVAVVVVIYRRAPGSPDCYFQLKLWASLSISNVETIIYVDKI